jgi:hypothetical protein
VPFFVLLKAKLAAYTGNYLTPFLRMGGEPLRALILKKERYVRFRKGLATVIVDKILEFSSGIIFLAVGIFYIIYEYALPIKTELTLAVALIVFILFFALFFFALMKRHGFFTLALRISGMRKIKYGNVKYGEFAHRHFKVVEDEITAFFKENKKTVIIVVLLSMLIELIMISLFMLLTSFLGFRISLIQGIVLFTLIIFSQLIPTPASLGSFEGMLAFTFSLFGIGAGTGVAFSLVIRALEVLTTLIGFIFFSQYGWKMMAFLKGKAKARRLQ